MIPWLNHFWDKGKSERHGRIYPWSKGVDLMEGKKQQMQQAGA